MDEVLGQILQELKLLRDGQERIEGRLDRMEDRISQLEDRMSQFEGRMGRMEADLSEAKTELKSVRALGQATLEQAGMLTEFRTEMKHFRQETTERLDRIEKTLEQHGKVLERLSFRSIEQEADILAIKRAK